MDELAQRVQPADAWNRILAAAGRKKNTTTDRTRTRTVNEKFSEVTSVTELGQLALLLESIAAETCQAQVAKLTSTTAVSVAASIQPVEMQHAAILYYVLGEYPGIQDTKGTPLAFSPTTQAV